MDAHEQFLVVALAEIAILRNAKEFKEPLEVFRLAAAFRAEQQQVLDETLGKFRTEYELIKDWHGDADSIRIVLSDGFPLTIASVHEKEVLSDKRIRRILLFKLYEVYREIKQRSLFLAHPRGCGT